MPDFCEFYIVSGGKLMHLREEEDAEGIMEDDQGMIITAKTRDKCSFKGWLGKIMFSESTKAPLPINQIDGPQNQWEDHVQEIENYFQQLLSSNADHCGNLDEDSGCGQSIQTDSASQVRFHPHYYMALHFSLLLD